MNIEKNKVFMLELPDIGSCLAIDITKNEKDYLLIRKEIQKLFKICLNAKNETEYYEKRIGLSDKLRDEILKNLENNITYTNESLNVEDFFVKLNPLKIDRFEIPYSLYLDGVEDNLTKYDWVAKAVEITSDYFDKPVRVFIYREKNLIVYAILNNIEKIVKYVFKIENNILNLIKEEHYNGYKPLEFLKLKTDFTNLTTTCHEMMRDISSKDENVIYSMKLFKRVFDIE